MAEAPFLAGDRYGKAEEARHKVVQRQLHDVARRRARD